MRPQTADEIAAEADLTRSTIWRMSAAQLLPAPEYVPLGRGRPVGLWPPGTARRAKLIAKLTKGARLKWEEVKLLFQHWLADVPELELDEGTAHLERLAETPTSEIRKLVLALTLAAKAKTRDVQAPQ